MSNWKYDIKDDLARYGGQLVAVTTLPDELRRLELEYKSIKTASTDTTPVQGGGTVYEDRLLSNIARRDKTAASLSMAQIDIKRMEAALACLNDTERHIVDVLYIHHQRGATERLREELGFENERTVQKVALKALRKLSYALYGREEK